MPLIDTATTDGLPVVGSTIPVAPNAEERVTSGRVGALKPRPQLTRSRRSEVALNFSPSFGVTAVPKSL